MQTFVAPAHWILWEAEMGINRHEKLPGNSEEYILNSFDKGLSN